MEEGFHIILENATHLSNMKQREVGGGLSLVFGEKNKFSSLYLQIHHLDKTSKTNSRNIFQPSYKLKSLFLTLLDLLVPWK